MTSLPSSHIQAKCWQFRQRTGACMHPAIHRFSKRRLGLKVLVAIHRLDLELLQLGALQ